MYINNGVIFLKNYISGFILSFILYIILATVNQQVYNNTMSLDLLMPLLVIQIFFYKYLITMKKRLPYVILVFIFLLSVFFSIPELTQNQSKEKVIHNFEMVIEIDGTVPIIDDNIWNPFNSNRAYFFKGYSTKLEKDISVMINANTGKVIVMD